MSIVVLTGVKTCLQSSGHERERQTERENERAHMCGVCGGGVYQFVIIATFGSLRWP